MKFFETTTAQHIKTGYGVCGDHYICVKNIEGTCYILCDGVGSGTYANIAAITCASRLQEHLRHGVSMRAAAEMVASSMHTARTQQFPFAAFVVAFILNDGSFDVYTYEAPEAILVRNGYAQTLQPGFYAAGLEVVGEVSGTLEIGDCLVLTSDGVTQAGMGHGRGFGIGGAGVSQYINRALAEGRNIDSLPEEIADFCASVSGGRYEDDTTCALIRCRPAAEVTLLTGPPSQMNKDRECVDDFMAMPGDKIVCGSTTIDILARELKREVTKIQPGTVSFASPPEYKLEGITLATEGAIMLNQVYNILGESPDEFEDGVVERFCEILMAADVIHFFIGNAINDAHAALIFKQMGVMPRRQVIDRIMVRLREMGKLVTEKYY